MESTLRRPGRPLPRAPQLRSNWSNKQRARHRNMAVNSSQVWGNDSGGLIRLLIEDRELVTDIVCLFDPDLPLHPSCMQFVCGKRSFFVVANGEDDTVEVCSEPPMSPVEARNPAYLAMLQNNILGKRISWARSMTNHLGFSDGVQFDFESEDVSTCFGLLVIAAASSLDVRVAVLPSWGAQSRSAE